MAVPLTRTSGSESSSRAAMLLQGSCCAMAALTCRANWEGKVLAACYRNAEAL